MTKPAARPVNQKARIGVLRAVFVLLLPILVFTRPVWDLESPLVETMEQVGIYCVIFAVLGRFWSILYSGGAKNRRVVREGPYSMARHPLYFFSTLGVAGLGLMSGSVLLALALTATVGGILAITARLEEEYLRRSFGAAYEEYAAEVPMILPNLRLFRTPERIEVTLRPLYGNFFDALVFLAFIPVSETLEWLKDDSVYPTVAIW
ncbi:methyltransferase family protein [Wenxinia marina]|uniref:Isoprenylcysteine carboxylmethyltransferase family protein n=1 Tax=Wenxinia marina DSM 24838 TaxID=1123501 RepID=A0A0D0Q1T3_9RHOB|nr:isoprenylcysteine carboxylmethyltransferase family protein [Wenxinia marina]KIQ68524.1 Putative protein-S-isoprenylcysteine methyltransferase [Wenxinia marina DSM 24838]GGL66579.1 sodium:proton antiporter [Wenxinia marina]